MLEELICKLAGEDCNLIHRRWMKEESIKSLQSATVYLYSILSNKILLMIKYTSNPLQSANLFSTHTNIFKNKSFIDQMSCEHYASDLYQKVYPFMRTWWWSIWHGFLVHSQTELCIAQKFVDYGTTNIFLV